MSAAFQRYIAERVPLTADQWAEIQARCYRLNFPMHHHLLEAGQVCTHLYFIESGLLRFYELVDGEEKTKFFTPPVQLFTSPASFLNQIPAQEFIQALLDSEVWAIPFAEVQELYTLVPTWGPFIRKVLLAVNRDTDALLSASKSQTAEARYLRLVEEEPFIVQNVSVKHLASYLGIAPESLSRIRRRLRNGS